jgi:hypothetical protein
VIIETRYRDISHAEATRCATPGQDTIPEARWEREFRGKPVALIVPAVPAGGARFFTCAGPFFRLAAWPEASVCPHIAEIGD